MLAPVAYGASEPGDPDPDRIIFVPFVTICWFVIIVISLKALYKKGAQRQPGFGAGPTLAPRPADYFAMNTHLRRHTEERTAYLSYEPSV